jgi:hypothetical protein
MTITARQNNLTLNEDWTTIYQTFKNADFKSYDFENIRRVIIDYIRENYPEDFNDYIESSEYMALVDAIAFMGQSLSFRIDLASRENFIELAERKESVLRLARMLSYNAKRNITSEGLLKFDTITTTEDIVDSNGRNLAQQVVIWNDPSNINWNEQFLLILNSAMSDNTEFGRSQGTSTIQGIKTDQYRFRTFNTDIPLFSFNKSVAGRRMIFEIVSTAFKGAEKIYEEDPVPGNQLAFVYRNDGKGPASANNGFFFLFKQGSLEVADFSVDIPTSNEVVSVDAEGINNTDVWLYKLDANAGQTEKWTQVPSLTGNNIAYNSLINGTRNFYNVVTKENDKIDLVFADGVYGNLPQGNFRVYYRVSNGLSYSIPPSDMRGISIDIPYLNSRGVRHTLTVTMGLKYTVSNSTESEDIDTIRNNAPAIYYTQNRMVTGEDYNLAPLSSSQNVLKVKSINRSSVGISRNFDLIDASGKYSTVDIFSDDGYIYKNESETTLTFKFTSKTDILNFVRNSVEPYFSNPDTYNFYLTKYSRIIFIDDTSRWNQITSDTNLSTGYFYNSISATEILKTGVYTNSTLKYLTNNALIKFIPEEGKAFNKKNQMLNESLIPELERKYYIWTKVINVVGDGTNSGRGQLSNGRGPVSFTEVIPSGAIASRIVPKFVSNLSPTLENQIANLVFTDLNFGLRYDTPSLSWKIITQSNLNLIDDFSLGKTGDLTGSNLDSSWIISFVKQIDRYVVRIRKMEYVFGSIRKTKFFFDDNQKVYDSALNRTVKDQVKVLGINAQANSQESLIEDQPFEISDSIVYEDGYTSADEIKLAFNDSDDDGVIDDPERFVRIVGEDQDLSYIFFEKIVDSTGSQIYKYFDNINETILLRQRETQENVNDYVDGQLIYFYDVDESVVKQVNRSTNTFNINNSYRANIGRAGLKFQYIHHADPSNRINPASSNIIDIYLLTKTYDTDFRNYLAGSISRPEVPTTDSLRIEFGANLNLIKSISDEIVFHPAKYRVLFGDLAEPRFRVTFKVVKNPSVVTNDNDLKVQIINAIDRFFDVKNWDFGDRFYASEMITYVITQVSPEISNMVMVPNQADQVFGSLLEIQSGEDEILISGATVDDIEIVSSISAAELNINPNNVITTT